MSKGKEKCIESECIHSVKHDINGLLIRPFEEGTTELQKLFSYFLHVAPDIESIHSKKIPVAKHDIIFYRMLHERHFKYQKFCASNIPINKVLEGAALYENMLCLKCKRFVCKKKKKQKDIPDETNLDCFLRHIRNAIAHGRVYYCHKGNRIHILFEDFNSSGNVSARIVCIKADLVYWKKILNAPDNFAT